MEKENNQTGIDSIISKIESELKPGPGETGSAAAAVPVISDQVKDDNSELVVDFKEKLNPFKACPPSRKGKKSKYEAALITWANDLESKQSEMISVINRINQKQNVSILNSNDQLIEDFLECLDSMCSGDTEYRKKARQLIISSARVKKSKTSFAESKINIETYTLFSGLFVLLWQPVSKVARDISLWEKIKSRFWSKKND